MERSLVKDEERISILEKMVLRLYEDIAAGRINEQNFNLMLEKTQKEQEELKAKISEGKKKLADEIRLVNSARQWMAAIQEYADIAELDAAVLNKLVTERIIHYTLLRKVVCQRRRCPLWHTSTTNNAMLTAGGIASFVVSSPFHGLRVVPCKLT